jgi:hypothetical protein
VDDAHQLSGRKLKLVQDCVRASGVFVMTTADENRISPSLRKDVLAQQPQTFRLNTDVAYDVTPLFMWCLIAGALIAGAFELALILGGLKMLGSGKRATKQA